LVLSTQPSHHTSDDERTTMFPNQANCLNEEVSHRYYDNNDYDNEDDHDYQLSWDYYLDEVAARAESNSVRSGKAKMCIFGDK